MRREISYVPDGSVFEIDTDVYKSTCGIVGDISDKSLFLKIGGDKACTDGKVVTLPSRLMLESKLLSKRKMHYTLLEHELAHILFQSDEKNFKFLMDWAQIYWKEIIESKMSKNLAKKGYKTQQFDIGWWNDYMVPVILNGCRIVYNIVEDHRIEHNWGEIYRGSKQKMRIMAKSCIDHEATTSFEVLLSVRANRWDYIADADRDLAKNIKDLIQQVEGKSPGMALLISKEIIKLMAEEFLKGDTPPKPKPKQPKSKKKQTVHKECPACGEGDGNQWKKVPRAPELEVHEYFNHESSNANGPDFRWECDGCGYEVPVTGGCGGDGEEEPDDVYEQPSYKTDGGDDDSESDEEGEDKEEEDAGATNDSEEEDINENDLETIESRDVNLRNEIINQSDKLQKFLDVAEYKEGDSEEHVKIRTKQISKEQKNAFMDNDTERMSTLTSKQNQKMMMRINEIINPDEYTGEKSHVAKSVGKIVTTDVFEEGYHYSRPIDALAARKLSQFFRVIRERNKTELDEEGDSIDPEAYIQFKANPNTTEIFNSLNVSQGLDISIVIDISGSMQGEPLDMSTRYARTLIESIKHIPNIKLKVYGYGGNYRDPLKTPVVELTSDRLVTIEPTQENCLTHTYNGVAWAINQMKGSQGKKLIILLTDGSPYHGADDETVGDAVKLTRESIEYAYVSGCKVFTIQIGNMDEEELRYMYGPKVNWTIAQNGEEAGQAMWSKVVSAIWRTLIV